METYQKSFGLSGAGSSTGIIFIIYNLGQIAAFPFCGFLADGYGRRRCIFVGCLTVALGTAVQTSSHTRSAFMGGRFILGFGAAIASVRQRFHIPFDDSDANMSPGSRTGIYCRARPPRIQGVPGRHVQQLLVAWEHLSRMDNLWLGSSSEELMGVEDSHPGSVLSSRPCYALHLALPRVSKMAHCPWPPRRSSPHIRKIPRRRRY